VVYRLMVAKLRGPCPRLETWGLGKRFGYRLTPMTTVYGTGSLLSCI
jgi:hypothetical protein